MTTTIQSLCKLQDNAKCRSIIGNTGDLNLNGKTLIIENGITINSTQQSFRFYNGTDYSMLDGKLDVNAGAVSINGSTGSQLQIKDLDFDLASGVTGTATYTSVYDSIVTYITSKMNATDPSNTNAGGTNTGWEFASVSVGVVLNSVSIFFSKLFNSFLRK